MKVTSLAHLGEDQASSLADLDEGRASSLAHLGKGQARFFVACVDLGHRTDVRSATKVKAKVVPLSYLHYLLSYRRKATIYQEKHSYMLSDVDIHYLFRVSPTFSRIHYTCFYADDFLINEL